MCTINKSKDWPKLRLTAEKDATTGFKHNEKVQVIGSEKRWLEDLQSASQQDKANVPEEEPTEDE